MIIRCLTIVVVISAALLSACSEISPLQSNSGSSVALKNADARITEVLQQLLQCSLGERDCYVIIEEPDSGIIVQFSGSTDEPLLLNLPFGQFTSEQRTKVAKTLSEFGSLDRDDDIMYLSLERDAEKGAEATVAILRDALRIDEDAVLMVTSS